MRSPGEHGRQGAPGELAASVGGDVGRQVVVDDEAEGERHAVAGELLDGAGHGHAPGAAATEVRRHQEPAEPGLARGAQGLDRHPAMVFPLAGPGRHDLVCELAGDVDQLAVCRGVDGVVGRMGGL